MPGGVQAAPEVRALLRAARATWLHPVRSLTVVVGLVVFAVDFVVEPAFHHTFLGRMVGILALGMVVWAPLVRRRGTVPRRREQSLAAIAARGGDGSAFSVIQNRSPFRTAQSRRTRGRRMAYRAGVAALGRADISPDVGDLVAHDRFDRAISRYQKRAGASHEEAKSVIYAFRADVIALVHYGIPPDVLDLARAGQPDHAAKRYAEMTGTPLPEALAILGGLRSKAACPEGMLWY